MKKVLLIIPCLLLITACSSNNEYQVSNLSLDNSVYPHITGAFKNNSDETCSSVFIDVEVISGSLKINQSILVYKTAPGEIKEINTYCSECKGLTNRENVEIKVKNINCRK